MSLKGYLEKINTQEQVSAMQLMRKFMSLFYKNYLNKLIAIFEIIDTLSLMVRPIIKFTKLTKQKQGSPTNHTNQQTKKNSIALNFCNVFSLF